MYHLPESPSGSDVKAKASSAPSASPSPCILRRMPSMKTGTKPINPEYKLISYVVISSIILHLLFLNHRQHMTLYPVVCLGHLKAMTKRVRVYSHVICLLCQYNKKYISKANEHMAHCSAN